MAKVFTITEGLENMGALKTGGQGSVYKARRIGEIITAVKLLPTPIHSESQDDKHFIDFQNEVNKLKKVNQVPNPNVVKILNAGITDTGSFPFIEMEYIEGPDLEELLKPPHDPVFTIKETIKVAEQLSSALAHCHKAEVKHGDIKSNNVKFNIQTGNYVLLDFGLAVMSDEQRRTSLRHAGAIEFMAPEQNEGRMLYQTDVYSFGVILYELLAGQVPFPLQDRGEVSRNVVMLAHMETLPPNLLQLRQQNMPAVWNEDKKRQEMDVPRWLVQLIEKCLQKIPQARFANGIELHQFISLNAIRQTASPSFVEERIALLEQENENLLRENERLQYLLQQKKEPVAPQPTANQVKPVSKKNSNLFLSVLGVTIAIALLIFLINSVQKSNNNDSVGDNATSENQPIKPRTVIGQFKVIASRAYFHNEPNVDTRRSAYMVPSNDVVSVLDEKNGFLYTEFTNSRGQTSKGWLRKQDLMPLDEWMQKSKGSETMVRLTEADINSQLAEGRALLEKGKIKEALYIYNFLSEQNVPEAMYHYGNLALQNRNAAIDCGKAIELVERASDKGFTAAKRTLGFLYVFADSPAILQANNYQYCAYDKNVFKGSKLLMEAVLEGDTTASRLMEEINQQRSKQEEGTEQE